MSSRGEHIRLRKGDVVGDRYEMLEEIGCGNFSKVYSCLDLALPPEERKHHLLAMKVMKKEYRKDAYFENKMLRIIAENDPLVKAHVCRLVDVFEWRRCPVFIMSMHGPSLRSRRLGLTHGVVTRAGMLALAYDVCESLRFIHFTCNMVHTDLKPENILIMDPNTPERTFGTSWVLCDFGSSSLWRLEKLDSDLISTRPYRAPEVVLGNPWHYAADMWSLGCILYEVATGHRLFEVHDDKAHLQLMVRRLGRLPELFTKRARLSAKFFNEKGELLPGSDMLAISRGRISRVKETFQKDPEFCSLLTSLLAYNPEKRLTATQALLHPVFQSLRQRRRISTTMLRAEEAALRAALSAGRTYVAEPLGANNTAAAAAVADTKASEKAMHARSLSLASSSSSSAASATSFAMTGGDLVEPAVPTFSLQELTRMAAKMPPTSSSSSTLPHNGGCTPSAPSKSTTATNSSSAGALVEHNMISSSCSGNNIVSKTATTTAAAGGGDAAMVGMQAEAHAVRASRRASAVDHTGADTHPLHSKSPLLHTAHLGTAAAAAGNSSSMLRGADVLAEMDSKASTLREATATTSSLPTAASTQTCRPGEAMSETRRHQHHHPYNNNNHYNHSNSSSFTGVTHKERPISTTNNNNNNNNSNNKSGEKASVVTAAMMNSPMAQSTRSEADSSISTAATAAAAVLARMRNKLDQAAAAVVGRREAATSTTAAATAAISPTSTRAVEEPSAEKPGGGAENKAQAKGGKDGLPSVISIRPARRVNKTAATSTAAVVATADTSASVVAPVMAKASYISSSSNKNNSNNNNGYSNTTITAAAAAKTRAIGAEEAHSVTAASAPAARQPLSSHNVSPTVLVSTKQPPPPPLSSQQPANSNRSASMTQPPCVNATRPVPLFPASSSSPSSASQPLPSTPLEVHPVPSRATPPLPLYVMHPPPPSSSSFASPATSTPTASIGVLPHVLSIDSIPRRNGLNASAASSTTTTATTATTATTNTTTTTTAGSATATHTIASSFVVDEGPLSSVQGSPITLLDSTVASLHATDHPSPRRRCRALPSSMNMSPGGVFSSFYSGTESPLTLTQTSNTTPLPHLQDELEVSTPFTSVSGQATLLLPAAQLPGRAEGEASAAAARSAVVTVATPSNDQATSAAATHSRTHIMKTTSTATTTRAIKSMTDVRPAATQVRVPPSAAALPSSSYSTPGNASRIVRLGGTKTGGLVSTPVLPLATTATTTTSVDTQAHDMMSAAAAPHVRRDATVNQPQATNATATSAQQQQQQQLLQLPANARPVQKPALQTVAKPPQTRRNLARYDEGTPCPAAATTATNSTTQVTEDGKTTSVMAANKAATPFADPGAHALYKMVHGKSPSRAEYGPVRVAQRSTTSTTTTTTTIGTAASTTKGNAPAGTGEKRSVQTACPPPSLRTRMNLALHSPACAPQQDIAAAAAPATTAAAQSTTNNKYDEARLSLSARAKARRSSAPVLTVKQRLGPSNNHAEDEDEAGVCLRPLPVPRRTLSPSPPLPYSDEAAPRVHTARATRSLSSHSHTSHEVSREPAWSTLSPLSSGEREASPGEGRYSALSYPHRSSFQAQSRLFERNIETLRSQLQADGLRHAGPHHPHSNSASANIYHSLSMLRPTGQTSAASKQRVYRSVSATVSRRTSLCVNSMSNVAAQANVTPAVAATESVPSTTRNAKGRHADPTTANTNTNITTSNSHHHYTRASDAAAPLTTRSSTVLPAAAEHAEGTLCSPQKVYRQPAPGHRVGATVLANVNAACATFGKPRQTSPGAVTREKSMGKGKAAASAGAKAASGADVARNRTQRSRRSPPNAKEPAAVRTTASNNTDGKGAVHGGVVYAKSTTRPVAQVSYESVNEDMPVPPPPVLKRAPRRSK